MASFFRKIFEKFRKNECETEKNIPIEENTEASVLEETPAAEDQTATNTATNNEEKQQTVVLPSPVASDGDQTAENPDVAAPAEIKKEDTAPKQAKQKSDTRSPKSGDAKKTSQSKSAVRDIPVEKNISRTASSTEASHKNEKTVKKERTEAPQVASKPAKEEKTVEPDWKEQAQEMVTLLKANLMEGSGEPDALTMAQQDGETASKANSPMGKFFIKSTKNDSWMFNLKASNGEVIATSDMYSSVEKCKKGIASVQLNAPIANLEDHTLDAAIEEMVNPKFEMYHDKGGDFRFRLRARNGEIIAKSQGYTSKAKCKNGIESVRKNAMSDIIVIEEPSVVK